MQTTHETQYDSHPHAFWCHRTFAGTYTAAVDAEKPPAQAIAEAWETHDRSVNWTYENVPLN